MDDNTQEKSLPYMSPKQAALVRQFVKYFGVAFVGLVADFGTLVMLHELLHVNHLLAAAAGFIVGLAVNYTLSSKYVFKNSKLNSRTLEFLLFGVVGIVGLGILSLAMWVLTDLLHVYYIVSKCIATIGVYLWNFFGRKALYND